MGFMQTTLFFFSQSPYAWHIFPFFSTPETFKSPNAHKVHFSKLPRKMKFRYSPTYSVSDFTGNAAAVCPNWSQWGLLLAPGREVRITSFLSPYGSARNPTSQYLGGLSHWTATPLGSLYYPGNQMMSRGAWKSDFSPTEAALSLNTAKLELGLPPVLSESQEMPVSEARHGRKEVLKGI